MVVSTHSTYIVLKMHVDHCPICCLHVQLDIQQLSTSAQHSIFNTRDEGSVDSNPNSDKRPKISNEKEYKLAVKINSTSRYSNFHRITNS